MGHAVGNLFAERVASRCFALHPPRVSAVNLGQQDLHGLLQLLVPAGGFERRIVVDLIVGIEVLVLHEITVVISSRGWRCIAGRSRKLVRYAG